MLNVPFIIFIVQLYCETINEYNHFVGAYVVFRKKHWSYNYLLYLVIEYSFNMLINAQYNYKSSL